MAAEYARACLPKRITDADIPALAVAPEATHRANTPARREKLTVS